MDFPPILNVIQCAELLQVGRCKVYEYMGRGMPHLRDGPRIIRFNRDAVLAWVAEQRGEIAHNKPRLRAVR